MFLGLISLFFVADSPFYINWKVPRPADYATPFCIIGPGCSTKFPKIIDIMAYSMQGIVKYIHQFFCNNSGILKWAWSCHIPCDSDQTSAVHLRTLLMHIDLLKDNFEKILNRFPVAKLQRLPLTYLPKYLTIYEASY